MPYATLDNLIDRYGESELVQLTDRVNVPPIQIDTAVVAAALVDADAIINGYLAGRYTLPLPATPPVLVEHASVIARYKLWKDAASDKLRADYEDSMKFLTLLGQGKLSLGVVPAPASTGDARITPALPRRRDGIGL